jgi:long-chain acyl-CoA synthetase
VPVVPVVLAGTDHILPPDKLVPRRRGVVQVRFGAPMRFAADTSYTTAAQQIEDALAALLKESQ